MIFAVALLVPTLFAERLGAPVHYVLPDRSGQGVLGLAIVYLIPILTGTLSLLAYPEAFSRVLGMRYAWVGPACLATDVAVYFASGLLERSFKAALVLPLAACASFGAVLTGIAMFKAAPAAVDFLVTTALTISALVGGFQMSEAFGYTTPIGHWIVRWDQAAAHDLGTTIAWRRAEGFSTNPNIYTPLAIVGFIWAIFGPQKGPSRWLTLGSASAIAVFGQSRTTLVVIAALLVLALVRLLYARMRETRKRRALVIVVVMLVLAGAVMAGRSTEAGSAGAGAGPSRALIAVRQLLTDPGSDPQVAARVDVWELSVRAIAQRPWGWFERFADQVGPYYHTHNEFLFRLLYAGPLWLLAHLVFLGWLWVWLRPKTMRWIGIAISIALLLNGVTEPLRLMLPYTVLLYAVIGCAMWAVADERSPRFARECTTLHSETD